MTGVPVDRRTVLGGTAVLAGLGALGACTDGSPTAPARRSRTTATGQSPDVALAATVVAEQQVALARLEATVSAHPALAPVLRGTRSVHRRHLRLLSGAVPSGIRSPSSVPRPPQVPTDPVAALTSLARVEDALAADGRRHALAARSGAFARVLASVAAASTQQQVHLTEAARARAARRAQR